MTDDSSNAQRPDKPLASIAREARPGLARATAFVLCVTLAATGLATHGAFTPARAADLALQPNIKRPGQLFAEGVRVPAVKVHDKEVLDREFWIPNSPPVPGYYGRPGDFHYRNYYGTSPLTIYSRLPYACGFVGLC